MLKQINPAHHDEAPSVRRLDFSDGPRQIQVELPSQQVRVRESVAALEPVPVAEPLRGGLFGRSTAAPRSDVAGAAKPSAEPPRIASGGALASPGAGLHKALASSPTPNPTQRNAPQPKALSGFLGSTRTPLAQPAHAAAEVGREAVATLQPVPQAASEPIAKSGVGRMLGAFRGRKPAEIEIKIDPPSVQERPPASGLGLVFTNKLAAPVASPVPSNGLGVSKDGAEAGGLVRLFERMLAPTPPVEMPKGPSRGKKVVKW